MGLNVVINYRTFKFWKLVGYLSKDFIWVRLLKSGKGFSLKRT